jgi:tungstate transport system ATP-binding protein
MTTAIALETSKGDLSLAVGLGMVLIVIVFASPGPHGVPASDWQDEHAGANCRSSDHIRRPPHLCGRGYDPRPNHTDTVPGCADRIDWSEWLGENHAAAHRDGSHNPFARAHNMGWTRSCPAHARAILFQRPAMLRRSASGNIRFALRAAGVPRPERHGRIRELLELVGLERLTDRPARRLSGGEQQRLALASALARDPAVLFLDEPTASLDPASTKAIEDVIRAVSLRGIKVVMSTHDLGEARRLAGEIMLLHRGRLIETGAASSFFNTPQTGEARAFIAGSCSSEGSEE